MKVFPIPDPLPGEEVLGVQPALRPSTDADWRRRLAYFAGRALTHEALHIEQRSRSGRLATLGQALSPGVISGLEVAVEQSGEGAVLELAAGLGLAANGEVITVNRNRQLELDALRVFAPASMLGEDVDNPDDTAVEGAARLGATLGELREAGRPLPQAMILVLQPVAVQHYDEVEVLDPCDFDPSDEAFENWQWLDGCRVVLYAWDAVLGALPAPGDWRRNRVAHAIFEYERGLDQGQYPPWASVGVPVALIGLDTELRYEFLDRAAVTRRGGEPKGDDVMIRPSGNRYLWQARFEQFNEQLVDWLSANPELDPADLVAGDQFRRLPPVGVLPADSIEPRRQFQRFFPLGYAVRALVVPQEQLDLAIAESASLLPYDINTPDRVELLVPVPQQHYEPQLLVVENLGPEFDQAINRFAALRDQWLGRRLVVRNIASALYQSVKGKPLLFRADDPGAIDSLEQATEFETRLVETGDTCRYLKGKSAVPGNWMQESFDDSGWDSGATGIGYGTQGLGTTLDDMAGGYVTLYLRHRFDLDAIEESHRYTLAIETNGGFFAFLNGRFLLSANVTGRTHNATAKEDQELETRRYELGELTGRLVEGVNVLAIQAHNSSLDSDRFNIAVSLLDMEPSFGTREIIEGEAPDFGEALYEVEALSVLRDYLDTATPLSQPEVDKLDEIGIEAYVDFLQRKIDQADDRVEFGFLRVRTDTYRIRQMMLGNEAGTKLATSPALAEIAKGESAVATRNELSEFYSRLKEGRPVSGSTPTIGTVALSRELGDAATPERDGATARFGPDAPSAGIRAEDATASIAIGAVAPGPRRPVALERDAFIGREASIADLFRPETPKFATEKEIGGQNPIIGNVQKFNNVTVGERLEESSANVSLLAGIAAKGEVLGDLLEAETRGDGINLEGLKVAGFQKQVDGKWIDDDPKSFAEIKGRLGEVLDGQHDHVIGDDEAAYFSAGVRALENVVGVLRAIEGRVQDYRRALTRCRSTMSEIETDLARTDQRLKLIGDELAEARHDVSVARGLKAEEESRIASLNARRDKILATQVPFLVFRRPRSLDPRMDLPARGLDPDLSDQPLPLCELADVESPESLDAMLDVVRDAPLIWFRAARVITQHLSRLADLRVTLSGARKRAASRVTVHPFLKTNFQVPDMLVRALGSTLMQSHQRIRIERQKTSLLDPATFERMGWRESIKRVPEVVSLGDVIDGNHGRMEASQSAAAELRMIARVATCLYVGFSNVPAGIRLGWAERFSQFDKSVNLRNLYSLPRFGELDYIERHNMQRLVDWLYGRINGNYRDAHDLISDLVRVAILTASHAPVNQVIAGYLPEPVQVGPGDLVRVVADPAQVRVGMTVSMVSAGATLVRGTVADISGGEVSAEVHTTVGERVQLDSGVRVQIGKSRGMMFRQFR